MDFGDETLHMKKRILVIDDDEDILAILSILFEDEGFEVILLKTGATAREVRLLHPDLVLLDVRIKGYDKTGDLICNEIKAQSETSDVPVILLSAEDDVPVLAHLSGANGYVRKPFNINDLISKVKGILV